LVQTLVNDGKNEVGISAILHLHPLLKRRVIDDVSSKGRVDTASVHDIGGHDDVVVH
jgi:hypothetical protein